MAREVRRRGDGADRITPRTATAAASRVPNKIRNPRFVLPCAQPSGSPLGGEFPSVRSLARAAPWGFPVVFQSDPGAYRLGGRASGLARPVLGRPWGELGPATEAPLPGRALLECKGRCRVVSRQGCSQEASCGTPPRGRFPDGPRGSRGPPRRSRAQGVGCSGSRSRRPKKRHDRLLERHRRLLEVDSVCHPGPSPVCWSIRREAVRGIPQVRQVVEGIESWRTSPSSSPRRPRSGSRRLFSATQLRGRSASRQEGRESSWGASLRHDD